MSHRCSLHCIVPPGMLERVARHGDDDQRAWALDTLSKDHSVRSARATNALLMAGKPKRLDVLGRRPAGKAKRTIYDMGNEEQSTGKLVRAEGDKASGDAATDEAYDGLGSTYDFYWEAFQRDSIDDQGLHLVGWGHYGRDYDNAFWDGQRMVFGDGDGQLFNRFTISLDVIGHELTHGVTEDEGPLDYQAQSGALNESISDVFGSLVKQHALGQTADQADWLIGAGLLAEGVQGKALRSMAEPGTAFDDPVLGKDSQPAHMRDYVRTVDDNGGVHTNSGIPNRAFYLVATKLGGSAWDRAGRIWYESLRDPTLSRTSGFRRFGHLTERVAKRLYGEGSDEATAVADAWEQVGVKL
jgi:Zn-dependent metalloprotease